MFLYELNEQVSDISFIFVFSIIGIVVGIIGGFIGGEIILFSHSLVAGL